MPIYWILVTSLKSPGDINTKIPQFFFSISFENYRKLLPSENIPIVGYLLFIQTLCGLLLFSFFSLVKQLQQRVGLLRNVGLIWNILFIITCLYGFFSTQTNPSRTQIDVRYHFFTLIICAVITYIIVTPRKKQLSLHSNKNIGFQSKSKERFVFVAPVILSTIGVCIILANGGSKYFYQLLNSIIIGGGSTVLAVGLGTFSAYAFSRFKIAGKDDLLFFILSTRMLPPVVVVIPIYLMYSALGLRDTHFGLILLYTTFNVSFAVWLMKGFIDEIPKEYEDAALVDGYTRFQTFMKVVLPQSITGIAATAVFCLITAWNEFAFALVLTETGGRAVTAPPSITSATGSAGMDWGKIAASTFVFLLPVAIFTFLMRNHLLRGVTFGAVKK
ncbi:hypothetical protein C6497_07760 [Candidatus Poribacteria bacterium]|nr:MAG: hypothetical protein C6497_07760 [Candidatus Poribacteria bacterium]